MTVQTEHDKILVATAKNVLLPLGFKRKGQSRLYFSDEGLWSCIIEFQPSGSSKGTYLNVAAHWLWTTENHISLDHGGRVGGFIEFHSREQWQEACRKLAFSAVAAVEQWRQTFPSIQDIASALTKAAQIRQHSGRQAFHAAAASALAGDTATARRLLVSITEETVSFEWERALQADALHLISLSDTPNLLRQFIMERIAASRRRLSLHSDIALP